MSCRNCSGNCGAGKATGLLSEFKLNKEEIKRPTDIFKIGETVISSTGERGTIKQIRYRDIVVTLENGKEIIWNYKFLRKEGERENEEDNTI